MNSTIMDTSLLDHATQRAYNSRAGQQEQSWKLFKDSVDSAEVRIPVENYASRQRVQSPAEQQTGSSNGRLHAVPKGGVRMDPTTGQVLAGIHVGEMPLPGANMTDDECRHFGIPVGSKWIDNEAVKNPISPLFDPGVNKVDWNELPVIGKHSKPVANT